MLHIQISLGTEFRLKQTLLNFWTKLTQKGYFRSKKEKQNYPYHRILHIPINLGSKFQLQEIILIFETKFQIKGYFRSKTEKMNTTNEFFVFEFILLPILSLN